MRVLILAALAAACFPALADNQLSERDREILAQRQMARDAQVARARERCIAERGVDCTSEQGLSEWILLDRSREDAVLDRVNSGVGSTTPPASVPAGAIRPAPR
jgi:type II secretory pathway pseudopilin PulG